MKINKSPILFVLPLVLGGCGVIQSYNAEGMSAAERKTMLTGLSTDRLCSRYNNTFTQPQTEKDVELILVARGLKECDALFKKRALPSVPLAQGAEQPVPKDGETSDRTRWALDVPPDSNGQTVPGELPTAPEPGGRAASQSQCSSGAAQCGEDSEIAQKQRRLACIHIELSDRQYKLEESRTPYLGVAQLYSRLPSEARSSIPFSGFITIARAKQEQISLDYLALGLIKEAMLHSPIPPKLGAEILAVVTRKDEQPGQQLRRLTTICSAK